MVALPSLFERVITARSKLEDLAEQSLASLPEESLFAHIEEAAYRIREALYRNEPLIIFGHDDPDGVTSTYLLYSFFTSCGFQRHAYYIPNRNFEPHGIQAGLINRVKEGAYKLLITVDNGISAYEGVEELNKLGCDVIITDHHLIQPELTPNAHSIINPHLPDCNYPFKALAGVGVALMLIRYLAKEWEHPIDNAAYFWTAVGSIADKVPMVGLNRLIVRYVINHFDAVQDDTIRFLVRNYKRMETKTDIFNFLSNTARLIANGREEAGEHKALSFILQLSDEKVRLFEELEEQKNIWENELGRVFNFLEPLTTDFVGNSFIYFDDEEAIPYSLLGTAATYIVNKLHIPTIIFKDHNGKMVCEGRCEDGFNMVEAFTHCKDHLIQFGGHAKAAGFSMDVESYDAFLECFNLYVQNNLKEMAEEEISYDTECTLSEMTEEAWERLELLLPWGQMNPEPTLLIKGLSKADLEDYWIVDGGGLRLNDSMPYDVLALWRNPNQIRILKILS